MVQSADLCSGRTYLCLVPLALSASCQIRHFGLEAVNAKFASCGVCGYPVSILWWHGTVFVHNRKMQHGTPLPQPCCQNLSGRRNTLRDSDTESQSWAMQCKGTAIWWNCSKTLHYAWLFTRQTHRTTQAVASTSHVHDLMHSQLGNFKLRQAVWQQITSCTCNLTNSCFSSPEIKAGLDQNACHRWSFSAFSMHVYSQDVGIFSGFPVCLPSEEAGIVGVQENCALDGVVLTSSVPASSLLSDLGT